MKRIHAIDITRGIVMIIMALDHVRDLMHVNSILQSPTNLATTTPFLFFTRWITYLCAPIFVFLAGSSAFLSLKRKNDIAATKKHLFKRGLSLMILEFTLVNFGLYFDPGFHTLLFEVIASTGLGLIILSLLLHFPVKRIGFIGIGIICLHNLAPLVPFSENALLKTILMPFFSPAAFPLFAGKIFIIGYPPIPWLGILLLGFAVGHFFEIPEYRRNQLFKKMGMIAIVSFIMIRFINIYGDSAQWASQQTSVLTILSFLNITKYPPSLLFCLATLGIMFFIIAYSENINSRIKQIISVYGKVPLFYFLVHFYFVHMITIFILFMQGFHWEQLEFSTGTFGRPKGIVSGLPLWGIYIVWILVVALLYQPCVWFGKYKSEKKYWWLSYL
jgi:uncharacterized membrane protein